MVYPSSLISVDVVGAVVDESEESMEVVDKVFEIDEVVTVERKPNGRSTNILPRFSLPFIFNSDWSVGHVTTLTANMSGTLSSIMLWLVTLSLSEESVVAVVDAVDIFLLL